MFVFHPHCNYENRSTCTISFLRIFSSSFFSPTFNHTLMALDRAFIEGQLRPIGQSLDWTGGRAVLNFVGYVKRRIVRAKKDQFASPGYHGSGASSGAVALSKRPGRADPREWAYFVGGRYDHQVGEGVRVLLWSRASNRFGICSSAGVSRATDIFARGDYSQSRS